MVRVLGHGRYGSAASDTKGPFDIGFFGVKVKLE